MAAEGDRRRAAARPWSARRALSTGCQTPRSGRCSMPLAMKTTRKSPRRRGPIGRARDRHSGAGKSRGALASSAASQAAGRLATIDFFGATGRVLVEGLLAGLESAFVEDKAMAEDSSNSKPTTDLKGRIWVTRQGVHVDRIACAWLIRRFIDSERRHPLRARQGLCAEAGRAAL